MSSKSTQYAVQLIGPGELVLNTDKPVMQVGPHQILAAVECVGLCFSDLKLLKQFAAHPRKSEIVSGISRAVLTEVPSYVPGNQPTVPGHEATCRIVAVGEKVKRHKVGERCLVQTDYRDLRTGSSNAAFGYNLEGALQEYVLMDDRVITDPRSGESFLIPVSEQRSASAIALVEPWACVENSYANEERRTIKAGGKLLVVSANKVDLEALGLADHPAPAEARWVLPEAAHELPNESFDDIIYFGADREVVELLNDKLAARGIINIVLAGRKINQPVSIGVGRIHYGLTRWIGTDSGRPAEAYERIPRTGELRTGEKIVVVGAGGPMGQMHVIRAVCSGTAGVSVCATDMDDARLQSLISKAGSLASSKGVELYAVNTQKEKLEKKFSYFALMAPIGLLVANAIRDSLPGALINIFAGIPAPTKQEIDLDHYIENRCFLFGTSGSEIRDMQTVLAKVESGSLDTNCSVDAVSGMAGAIDGLNAVENRTLAGKIVVYPMLHRVGLIPLTKLAEEFPSVAEKLDRGAWSKEAEAELLRINGA